MKALAKRKKTNRTSSMPFRVSQAEKILITKAARTKNFDDNSAYVRKSVITQAQIDLADRTEFNLSPKQMKDFLDALDRPVQKKPRLKKLLNEKSILDE